MENTILSILGSGGFVGIVTYFFTRSKTKQEVRKLKAEAQGDELDNVLKMQAIIEKINEPLKKEVERQGKEISELQERLKIQDEKNAQLTNELKHSRKIECSKENCPNRI